MAWRQALGSFLRSAPMISMFSGIGVTGFYVMYKDYSRYHRMMDVYKSGNILPPFAENQYEVSYLQRPNEEKTLRKILNSDFCNEYYLVNGEVGTGKTRTVIEIIRDMIKNEGAEKKGAPVYVLVTQGKSFPESLAAAVKFYFDEHISYSFFLDFALRIESFPKRDNDSKLMRVLDAIEESSFLYMMETGRPVVLVIDGINNLSQHMPGALEKLQDKAKLWADTNTVKMVLINNDEETEMTLQKNSSSWSRAATPIVIDDLTREEAIKFLRTGTFLESDGTSSASAKMSFEHASEVVNLVGGRIIHLLTFKREFLLGVPFEMTADQLKDREREKFIHVSRMPSTWNVVSALRSSKNESLKLSKIIKMTSEADVNRLAKHNIIRYVRDDVGVLIKFQSDLTEHIVNELEQQYLQDKEKTRADKKQDDDWRN